MQSFLFQQLIATASPYHVACLAKSFVSSVVLCETNDLISGMSEEAKKAMPEAADSVNNASNMPRNEPRLLKTHLSYDMLPEQVREKKPKIVYVTRNPRDAVVSYYNHWKALCGFTGIE